MLYPGSRGRTGRNSKFAFFDYMYTSDSTLLAFLREICIVKIDRRQYARTFNSHC